MLFAWSIAWLIAAAAPAEAAPSLATPADRLVSDIAFRLASTGRSRCPLARRTSGLTLRHLGQYEAADRPAIVAIGLDRGPAVLAVAAGSPAATADIRPGDILLAVAGAPPPPEDATLPFDAKRARTNADAVLALVAESGAPSVELRLLRDGQALTATLRPIEACRSIVHLARSDQRNAYADGAHVFVTTRMVADARGEDEVAFVIAHEMAHNALGHAAAMRRAGVRRGLARTLGRSGTTLREAERAADRLGTELMLDAGYDPVAGAEILHRLGGPDLGIAFLAAHDAASARIDAIRAIAEARREPAAPTLAVSTAR